MKKRVTERPNATTYSELLREASVHASFRFIVLSVSSLLLAPVANSQRAGSLARIDRDSRLGSHDVAMLGSPMTTIESPFLQRTNRAEYGRAIAPAALDSSSSPLAIRPVLELVSRTSPTHVSHREKVVPGDQNPNSISVYLRHPTGDVFLTLRAVSGGGQAPDQLLATIGLRALSIRFNSWRAVGRGASVEAGTFSCARSVTPVRSQIEIGLGAAATVYRFGARFDPTYRRHPFSINGFFRIRFGSHDSGPAKPSGNPMSS